MPGSQLDVQASAAVAGTLAKGGYARNIVLAALAVGIAVVATRWQFVGRPPNPDLTSFGTLLGTLLFASAILERAMDVWLSIAMGGKADRLDAQLRGLRATIDAAPPDQRAEQEAKMAPLVVDRTAHRDATRQLATPVSLVIGLVISTIGLRSLQPLFDKADAAWLTSAQGHVFVVVDILVTGTLLAGGSDGIHWIIALYRDWVDKSRTTTG
jgi:hypothetical protein